MIDLENSTKILSSSFSEIISACGDDLQRQGLKDTPKRAAAAFTFLTQGYYQDLETIVNGAIFPCSNDNMVIVKQIEFFSLCEHHLLPIIGHCHIGYKPKTKVLGLSKFARIVNMYARRFQIQENLTKQISTALIKVTGTQDVGVRIEATHLCLSMRGVQKQNASMVTSVMEGLFKTDNTTQKQFFNALLKEK